MGDASVVEGEFGFRYVRLHVTLSAPSLVVTTVKYSVTAGNATAGNATAVIDFTPLTNITLTFNPGVVRKVINVRIFGDSTVEGNETFDVVLSIPTGGTLIGRVAATGTIIDDDLNTGITVGIGDVSVIEGDSGRGLTASIAQFAVTLNTTAPVPVSVKYTTSNVTAAAGDDYTAATATLTFNPGAYKKYVTIKVRRDTAAEPDKTFAVDLSNPVGLMIGRTTGTGRIVDDDGEFAVPSLATPGDTSEIQLVSSAVQSGYHVDFYRNLAYPCSISGYQTFAIGYPLGMPASATKPLWVKMHGGGVGYFDTAGTPQPDEVFMREETMTDLIGQASYPGLMEQVRNDPEGFRLLAVSMCNRDLYSGGNQPDPNNPNRQPDGKAITTNGLYATKAAIQFAKTSFATTKVFLYGASAGSAGAYSVAWAFQLQGTPVAGIVADGYLINQEWLKATLDQQIPCSGRSAANSNAAALLPRLHPTIAAITNEPDKLFSSGRLTVPIAQVWSRGDFLSCGQTSMTCLRLDGTAATMGSVDCQNEPLRSAIAAQGLASRSLSVRLCVNDPNRPTEPDPCDRHVATEIAGTNTDPAFPTDYNTAIMNWVRTRLAE